MYVSSSMKYYLLQIVCGDVFVVFWFTSKQILMHERLQSIEYYSKQRVVNIDIIIIISQPDDAHSTPNTRIMLLYRMFVKHKL
jgi:hypothetical protein